MAWCLWNLSIRRWFRRRQRRVSLLFSPMLYYQLAAAIRTWMDAKGCFVPSFLCQYAFHTKIDYLSFHVLMHIMRNYLRSYLSSLNVLFWSSSPMSSWLMIIRSVDINIWGDNHPRLFPDIERWRALKIWVAFWHVRKCGEVNHGYAWHKFQFPSHEQRNAVLPRHVPKWIQIKDLIKKVTPDKYIFISGTLLLKR